MKTNAILAGLVLVATFTLTGCASVPLAPAEQDTASKTFAAPPADKAGLYVFRNTWLGQALTKTLYLDGVQIGETSNKVFLHRLVAPGEHKLSTESEFGDNDIQFTAEAGKNHFFEQYIRFGVFVGGANLQAVTDEVGRKNVLECKEALGGTPAPVKATSDETPQL